MQIPLKKTLEHLSPQWPDDLLPAIRCKLKQANVSVVVLDDDPTGTQTVYDVPILTNWTADSLAQEFEKAIPLFYVLTNSRSLPQSAAESLACELGTNLQEASHRTGRSFAVISRSDSTMRGHFPAEVDALAQALGLQEAVRVIAPFFLEGGRYTINDVHYVREDEFLVPAAQTQFAKDAVFGYSNSDLKQWVEEKTQGKVSAASVVSFTLEDIRTGGPERVTEKLLQCNSNDVCVVNAAAYRDLEVFILSLLSAEQSGTKFLYRTAASFVRTRAGLSSRPLLAANQLPLSRNARGLVIIGSYVPRSSTQLYHLLENTQIKGIEIQVERLLSEQTRSTEIERATAAAEEGLLQNSDVVLFTSRTLITGRDSQSSLAIGNLISDGLVKIVKNIYTKPRYILAKGGITSSDIATKALGIKRGWVLGQILPGVPVWQTGPETRFPELCYIVFPGNVGGPEAITEIVDNLS